MPTIIYAAIAAVSVPALILFPILARRRKRNILNLIQIVTALYAINFNEEPDSEADPMILRPARTDSRRDVVDKWLAVALPLPRKLLLINAGVDVSEATREEITALTDDELKVLAALHDHQDHTRP
jgi:hypothetical protein